MSRLNTQLLLLLAVQLALVAAIFWPRDEPGYAASQQVLLALSDTEAVERILVSDGEASLLLQRSDDEWSMPAYHQLPADRAKVERALQQLPALERGFPVATSTNASERFEVSPDNYQRQLQYIVNETSVGEIYLGTSPGFRKVHARVNDESEVFSVSFNSFDVPTQAAEWLEKSLLQIDGFTALRGQDFHIKRADDEWVDDGGQAADPDALSQLLNGLRSLRVTAAVDIATAAILADTPAPPTLSVETSSGWYDYTLYSIDESYYLKRSDVDVYFTISQLDFDRLQAANATALFPASDQQDGENQAAGGNSDEAAAPQLN